ncbi:MAG TPA: YHS domain-containing protein [Armatimonadaceae bacterium]|nr:YHS domain-containing protein [Armatimonadaceae bacterium]
MASDAQVKDPVCGMMIDPARAAGQSEYQGKVYYFCADVCKQKFDARPDVYASGNGDQKTP